MSATTAAAPKRGLVSLAYVGLLTAWVAAVIWRAWVTDDAFITLRVVDNALNGYGLRWNVAERVQVYTHPLWMFAILVITPLFGSAYLAVNWLSIACSTAAAALVVWRLSHSLFASTLAVLLMGSSRAFLDFSTSGLENPLTHLLLASFVLVWGSQPPGARRTFWLALLLALVMLNRIDAGLLVLPAFVLAAWHRPLRPHLVAAALGVVPFVAWEVFSVIYYGFPFPNTAYAKLATGISFLRLLVQGGHYVANSLRWDTVTLLTVAAALVAATRPSLRHLRPLALGVALYLLYILRIGGDFMFGRFFAAPFFMALLMLCQVPWPRAWTRQAALLAGIIVLRVAVLPAPTEISMAHGITDQRALFGEATRLITQHELPAHERPNAARGLELRRGGRRVIEFGMIGMTGYYAGPEVHIVDYFALADPLLARRPADPNSRIGHFRRRIPAGYLESLRTDRNLIESARIARYYADVRLVTRGPLWTWERWRAIVRLNLFERTM